MARELKIDGKKRIRNKMFNDFYNSHNCNVRKVRDNLTEAEAFMLEHFMILYYINTTDFRLTNQNCGGLSKGSYFQMSEERIKAYDNMRGKPNYKNKGINNGMYGRSWKDGKTNEEIEQIGNKISDSLTGKEFSEERRKRISDAKKESAKKAKENGKSLSYNARPVMIVNKITKEVVAYYPSLRQANGNGYVKGDLHKKAKGKIKNHKEQYEIMFLSYRIEEKPNKN